MKLNRMLSTAEFCGDYGTNELITSCCSTTANGHIAAAAYQITLAHTIGNCPFLFGDLGPHLTHGSLGPPESMH